MDHTGVQHVGPIVAEALAGAGLSEREAAERANIPRSTLKRHLVDGDFTVPQLIRVARVLGTRGSVLLDRAERVLS